jgi:hypothetical protein
VQATSEVAAGPKIPLLRIRSRRPTAAARFSTAHPPTFGAFACVLLLQLPTGLFPREVEGPNGRMLGLMQAACWDACMQVSRCGGSLFTRQRFRDASRFSSLPSRRPSQLENTLRRGGFRALFAISRRTGHGGICEMHASDNVCLGFLRLRGWAGDNASATESVTRCLPRSVDSLSSLLPPTLPAKHMQEMNMNVTPVRRISQSKLSRADPPPSRARTHVTAIEVDKEA